MQLKSREEHAIAAKSLADSFEMVQHQNVTYIPAHWLTGESTPLPPPGERIWLPLSNDDKLQLANHVSGILFNSTGESRNFNYLLQQVSKKAQDVPPWLMMRTNDGLMVLTETGELLPADGTFLPNYIKPKLNNDPELKAELLSIITEWVGGEDEAESLLNHLATCLSPGWSAGKYILLIGDGRNGKSVLLSMLAGLFGRENTSNVTRQAMSEKSVVCTELNGKLLNLVYDGQAEYLKDSGVEKSLVTGEEVGIRMLFENNLTPVQSNALFIEGLNKEPKSRDKGMALQKRMARFYLPNTYDRDVKFERRMKSEEMLGAFLALLLDRFVLESHLEEKLVMSLTSLELQAEHMYLNSPVIQFLEHAVQVDPKLPAKLVGAPLDPLIQAFMAWRITAGHDLYSAADSLSMFKECFVIYRKTVRNTHGFTKEKVIKGLKPSTTMFLEVLVSRGDDVEDITAVVAE